MDALPDRAGASQTSGHLVRIIPTVDRKDRILDGPATLSALGVLIAGMGAGYALNGVRKSHRFKREADTRRAAGDTQGATESLKRAAEELELANLVPPVTFRLLALGIAAQMAAALWTLIAKLATG